jgi:flagellar protein FliO/FliZ
MMRRFLLAYALVAGLASGAAGASAAVDSAASSASTSASSASASPASAAAASAPATSVPAASAPTASPAIKAPAPVIVPQTIGAGPAAGSLLQTIFSLMAVLALLALLAWFMKRYGPKAQAGSAHVRMVGALNLGGRERILVVEVGEQWIVVGASPGRVNALATMPRQDTSTNTSADATLAPHQPPASSFAEWLKQTIDKRNAK